MLPHIAIRSDKFKLIYFYTANEWELYDLIKDPGEQKNLAGSSLHKKTMEQMQKELLRLRDLYDDHEPAGVLDAGGIR